MYLKIAILMLFLFTSCPSALAELFRCDGVWQNKECEQGQSAAAATRSISKIEKGNYQAPSSLDPKEPQVQSVDEVSSKNSDQGCVVDLAGLDVRIVSANISVRSSMGNKIERITLKVKNFSETDLFSSLSVGLYPLGRPDDLEKHRIADYLSARSTTSYTLPAIVSAANSPQPNDYVAILLYEPARRCDPYVVRMSSATTASSEAISMGSNVRKIENELDVIAADLKKLTQGNPIVWKGNSKIAAEKVRLQTSLNSICARTRSTKAASRVASQCRELSLEINKIAR